MSLAFDRANILMPQGVNMRTWAVIACDQFTSQPAYWDAVTKEVGDDPSTLRLVLPEIWLSDHYEDRIPAINQRMQEELDGGRFEEIPDAFIYVERTLLNGQVRRGLLGCIDLDQYDYRPNAQSAIRATERTVVSRIPPRKKIREHAPLELPHVLLLCDDDKKQIIEPLTACRDQLPRCYDFDLMQHGGHLSGWRVEGEMAAKVAEHLAAYEEGIRSQAEGKTPMLYAVGDGNHSLATAKACWEEIRRTLTPEEQLVHPARYALVELENIQDDAQSIEPIHRIVTRVSVPDLLSAAESICAEEGYPVEWISGTQTGTLTLSPKLGSLPVAILQDFLDRYLAEKAGDIDYIHGEEALAELSQDEDSIGFLMPSIGKHDLFAGINADGVLPRKTFSMGHAQEKRYYLEARKIR